MASYADYDAYAQRYDIGKLLAPLSKGEHEKAERALAIMKRKLSEDVN